MKRLLAAAVAAALVLLAARAAGAADVLIPANQNYQGHFAYNLGAPGSSPVPATSPELFGGHASVSLPVSQSGTLVDLSCAVDGFVVQRVSGAMSCSVLTGASLFTPVVPLVFSGSNLELQFDNASITLNVGNALQTGAETGAITKGAGATTTAFGSAAGLSLLGVTGSSAAVPAFFSATANNQVAQMLAGVLQFHALDLSQVTGTVSASQFPAVTGAIVSAGATLATTFGVQAGPSLFGVATGSSAVPAPIVASSANTVPLYNGTSIAFSAVPAAAITGLAAIATSGSANDLVAGTIPTARLPVFTTDVVNAGLSMVIQPNVVTFAKTQTIPALSVVVNPTTSTANETTVATTSGSKAFLGENGSGALAFQPLTPSAAGTIATWTGVAFFAVDGGAGNDTNTCFSTVSQAAAGAVACKTIAGVLAKIPMNGNFQGARVAVKTGTYAEPVNLSGFFNYSSLVVVGTGTNSTAGSVAFANDANDGVYVGAVTATGMNAAGYNPTGTPSTTSFTAQLAGGGAPAFPSEPARPLGVRMRFDSATSTASLHNFINSVFQVTGGNQLTNNNSSLWPATPTTSDTFYLEEPGVSVQAITIGSRNVSVVGLSGTSLSIVAAAQGSITLAFTEISGAVRARDGSGLSISAQYINNSPVAGDTVGFGLLTYGQLLATNVAGMTISDSYSLQTGGTIGFSIQNCNGVSMERFISTRGVFLSGSPSWNAGFQNLWDIGTNTSTQHGQPARIIGPATVTTGVAYAGGIILSADVGIEQIVFSNMGSAPAIQMTGTGYSVNMVAPTGSLGNTGVGIAFPGTTLNGQGWTVSVGLNPTVTGTAGDIALADGTIATWAQAAAGLSDTGGNRLIGTSTPFPIRVMPAGTTLSGGTLTVPNLAGTGGFAKLDTTGKFITPDPNTYVVDPGSNGMLARVSAGTFAARTLVPADGTITITNGNGVAGAPTFAVGTIAESQVTNLVTDLAGKQPTGNYITGISSGPVGFSGFSAGLVASTINLGASGFTSVLPIVDLAPGSTGQQLTMVGTTVSWVTPTAATVYTGVSPIIVNAGTGQISCPTCGTSSGSVTGVFGTLNQINVTPSSPNPTVSLAPKGVGAGSYGGTGIASLVVDAFGGINNLTTATYLTATGTTPGTYNQVTDTSDGLIASASNTSWMTAGALMKSGGPSAVPVAATGCVDYFDVRCAGVGADVGGPNNATGQVFGVHDDSGQQWRTDQVSFAPGQFLKTTSVPVDSFETVALAVSDVASGWPAVTNILVSSGPTTGPVGDANFTYNTSTHALTSHGANILGSATGIAALNAGVLSTVVPGAGINYDPTTNTLSASSNGFSKTKMCYLQTTFSVGTYTANTACGDTTSLSVVPYEWPNGFVAATVATKWYVETNGAAGTSSYLCQVTRNGIAIGGSGITVTSGTTTGIYSTSAATGSASANDTYGELCSVTGSGFGPLTTVVVTSEVTLTP